MKERKSLCGLSITEGVAEPGVGLLSAMLTSPKSRERKRALSPLDSLSPDRNGKIKGSEVYVTWPLEGYPLVFRPGLHSLDPSLPDLGVQSLIVMEPAPFSNHFSAGSLYCLPPSMPDCFKILLAVKCTFKTLSSLTHRSG